MLQAPEESTYVHCAFVYLSIVLLLLTDLSGNAPRVLLMLFLLLMMSSKACMSQELQCLLTNGTPILAQVAGYVIQAVHVTGASVPAKQWLPLALDHLAK